jgi:hypothetical protein
VVAVHELAEQDAAASVRDRPVASAEPITPSPPKWQVRGAQQVIRAGSTSTALSAAFMASASS